MKKKTLEQPPEEKKKTEKNTKIHKIQIEDLNCAHDKMKINSKYLKNTMFFKNGIIEDFTYLFQKD